MSTDNEDDGAMIPQTAPGAGSPEVLPAEQREEDCTSALLRAPAGARRMRSTFLDDLLPAAAALVAEIEVPDGEAAA
ncbi:unnamed protein product [Lampetra planeri]